MPRVHGCTGAAKARDGVYVSGGQEVRRDESTLLSDQWRRIPGMDSIEHGVTVVTAITEVRYDTKINN